MRGADGNIRILGHGGYGKITGELRECDERVIDAVLTAATCVHSALGPELLESVYEAALCLELEERGLQFQRQAEIPVYYHKRRLGVGFRADLIIEESLLLELKSVDEFSPVHLAVTINYLKLLGIKRGFLLNFNKRLLKEGIKRVSI